MADSGTGIRTAEDVGVGEGVDTAVVVDVGNRVVIGGKAENRGVVSANHHELWVAAVGEKISWIISEPERVGDVGYAATAR